MISVPRTVVRFMFLLLVTVSSADAQNLSFVERPIDSNFQGMSCAVVFDLDGDGDKDIVGGSEWTPGSASIGIAWWRNDGGEPITWTRFPVDPSFINVMSVEVAYVDSDTFPDIVATSWDQHAIAWWKHSGTPTTNWQKRYVRQSFTNAHDAECFDMNQDGYTDVVGVCSTPGNVIVCYHNGSSVPGWDVQTLTTSFTGGKSVEIIDFDHDGDPDILGTAADANQLVWWENSGGDPILWLPHVITSGLMGSHDVDAVYMNGDSLYDLITTGWRSNEVSYWLCDDLAANQWTKRVVTYQLDVATKALGRDFDDDGDIDIVAVGKIPGELITYENDSSSWIPTTLRHNFTGGWALTVSDLDDDGALDFVAGASALGTLSWWENTLDIVSVQITSFTAEALASGVKIEWDICSDEHIQGFRIYRRNSDSHHFELANSDGLIPVDQTAYIDRDVEGGQTYTYLLAVMRGDGSEMLSPTVTVRVVEQALLLNQNYPNPFNPATVISFTLPARTHANLSIFSVDGDHVATLVNEIRDEGINKIAWDGSDFRGNPVSSGVYLYRLKAGSETVKRKMVLIK